MRKIFFVAAALLSVSVVQASVWMPIGTASGGVAVYYNTVAQGTAAENPSNQAYYKAQFNNSTTATNGAAFVFVPELADPLMFNDLGQYGFDLVVTAPTSNGNVPTPVLNAYDNTNNTLAGRSLAGPVVWAINDYKDSGGGPGNPANGIINSLIRGGSGEVIFSDVTPIMSGQTPIGWQVSFTANLVSDGIIHWYNPAFPDSPMSMYVQDGQWWSGNFRASGTLTYLTANDTTAGMDFYSGSVRIDAEVIPEPATMVLLGLGGLLCGRLRKK